MSTTTIYVRGKLEIMPGNVIRIPGMEPVSSFTSLALAVNSPHTPSYITLQDALAAIPNATIEKVLTPSGFPGTGKFFVLPDGPPNNGNTCPPNCVEDWYQVLRDNAQPIEYEGEEDGPEGNCSGFNYSGCLSIQDQFHKAPDLNIRPNQEPLQGVY